MYGVKNIKWRIKISSFASSRSRVEHKCQEPLYTVQYMSDIIQVGIWHSSLQNNLNQTLQSVNNWYLRQRR
jgi:hypothetical protein